MMRDGDGRRPLNVPIRHSSTQQATYVDKSERRPRRLDRRSIS